MKTLQKIQKAIEIIKKQNLKKKGKNTYSNYEYYTPEQVSELVTLAAHEVKILPKFDLIRSELGISGRLSIFDLETDTEPVVYEMASDIPSIKATNISQQLGGAMTYTKRYLQMNAFDITDNNLDFDTTENTKSTQKETENVNKKLNSAISKLKDSKTIPEVKKVWDENEDLQGNKAFIKIVNNTKKNLS